MHVGKERAYRDGKSDGEGLRAIHQLTKQSLLEGTRLQREAHTRYYHRVADLSSPYFTDAEEEMWYTRGFLTAYIGSGEGNIDSPIEYATMLQTVEYGPSLWQRLWQRLCMLFSRRKPYTPLPVDNGYYDEYHEAYEEGEDNG